MSNILVDDLPLAIKVDNEEYSIYTDFRDWIELQQMFLDHQDDREVYEYIVDLFEDKIPSDMQSAIDEIITFMKRGIDKDKSSSKGSRKSKIVFSFNHDADYVLGGFLECYGIDLMDVDYMHWFKFNSLLNALNENCELKQRISYRSIDLSSVKNKQERNRIRKIQQRIAIPIPEIDEDDIARAFE